MKFLLLILLLFSNIFLATAQDTFSIVAVDALTGEVGSAGASCVAVASFPGLDDDFLGELFPNLGAINSQAYYHATSQANARNRMNAGDTPDEIIQWLIDNDVHNAYRQYGIVAFVNGSPVSAAHTGSSTDDYKGHLTGTTYSIQGNILSGQEVLDNMEAGFNNTDGDLACKLMGAMQGANMVGADSRCTNNGTSSLFAFLKVAQPDDVFGNPSFLISVSTSYGDGIEPIDSLQVLFDAARDCNNGETGTSDAVISLELLLEGFFDSSIGRMQTMLQANGLLPLNQPFNTAPWNHDGTEVWDDTLEEAVDWVLVVVRDSNDPATILAQQACILDEDGTLRNMAFESALRFNTLAVGSHYVSIYHKSHLPIISAAPVEFKSVSVETSQVMNYSFIEDPNSANGTEQLKKINVGGTDKYGMYCGDFNNDNQINDSDYQLWKQNGAKLDQYLSIDADGNGVVNNIDHNFWAKNKPKLSHPDLQ